MVEIDGLGLVQVVLKTHEWDIHDNLQQFLDNDKARCDVGVPLARWAAIQEQNTPRIVLTISHVLYDGWSFSIIKDQLCKAYQGQRIPRRPSFNNFIGHLLSQDLEDGKQFWKSRLRELHRRAAYSHRCSQSLIKLTQLKLSHELFS